MSIELEKQITDLRDEVQSLKLAMNEISEALIMQEQINEKKSLPINQRIEIQGYQTIPQLRPLPLDAQKDEALIVVDIDGQTFKSNVREFAPSSDVEAKPNTLIMRDNGGSAKVKSLYSTISNIDRAPSGTAIALRDANTEQLVFIADYSEFKKLLSLENVTNVAVYDATLERKGITNLSNKVDSDSETEASTPLAVNTVRKVAELAKQIADSKWLYVDGSLTKKGALQLSEDLSLKSNELAATIGSVSGVYDSLLEILSMLDGMVILESRTVNGPTYQSGRDESPDKAERPALEYAVNRGMVVKLNTTQEPSSESGSGSYSSYVTYRPFKALSITKKGNEFKIEKKDI